MGYAKRYRPLYLISISLIVWFKKISIPTPNGGGGGGEGQKIFVGKDISRRMTPVWGGGGGVETQKNSIEG